jgi:uncharacterized PurR-regulated membrane protein YhhQ (DUF165 family)
VTIVITSYVIKLVAAIVMTPAIYGLHEVIEKRYGLEPVAFPHPTETNQSGGE